MNVCAIQKPRTSWFLFETNPRPSSVSLQGVDATPALSLLPLRAQSILSSDICFAPTIHALPTSIQTGTMDATEDGEDKDIQLRLVTSVMRGGLTEGEVFRENVTVACQLKSRRHRANDKKWLHIVPRWLCLCCLYVFTHVGLPLPPLLLS